MNTLNEKFRLSKSVQLQEIEVNHIGIVRKVKSRIIRKDAQKIVETADKMRGISQSLKISLICYRNICSKSLLLLAENGIEVMYV